MSYHFDVQWFLPTLRSLVISRVRTSKGEGGTGSWKFFSNLIRGVRVHEKIETHYATLNGI